MVTAEDVVLEFGLDRGGFERGTRRNAGATGHQAEEAEANAIRCKNTKRQ